jgi:hypothetical protein
MEKHWSYEPIELFSSQYPVRQLDAQLGDGWKESLESKAGDISNDQSSGPRVLSWSFNLGAGDP